MLSIVEVFAQPRPGGGGSGGGGPSGAAGGILSGTYPNPGAGPDLPTLPSNNTFTGTNTFGANPGGFTVIDPAGNITRYGSNQLVIVQNNNSNTIFKVTGASNLVQVISPGLFIAPNFKNPTNAPTATATNLCATSTAGDTAYFPGQSGGAASQTSPRFIFGGNAVGFSMINFREYGPMTGYFSAGGNPQDSHQQFKTSFTLTNLLWHAGLHPIGTSTNLIVDFYTNDVECTTLKINAVGDGSTTDFSDTSGSVVVQAGTTIAISVVGNNPTGSAGEIINWSAEAW